MKQLYIYPVLLATLFAFDFTLMGQNANDTALLPIDEMYFLETIVTDGDTMPLWTLGDVSIVSSRFPDKDAERSFNRLKRRVETVYPYLVMAKTILAELDSVELYAKRKREYKRYKKTEIKEMKEIFDSELRAMSRQNGYVLVKLINRETGNNCYKLIKELKGGFTASIYNMVGKRYGYNLKEYYDRNGNPELELVLDVLSETGKYKF